MKLLHFLSRSSATAPFRDAIEQFVSTGRASERIEFSPTAPPIKIERTLIKVLESYPDLEIEAVEIRGRSGCEFFRGEVFVHTGTEKRRVHFEWNCKWKAQEHDWVDYFGFPDQTRAAREFGYDCFRQWDEEVAEMIVES